MSDNEEANKNVDDLDEFDLEDIDEADEESELEDDVFEREDKADKTNGWLPTLLIILLILALLAGAGYATANWLPKNQLTSLIPSFFSVAGNTPTVEVVAAVQITPILPTALSQGEANPPQSEDPNQTEPVSTRAFEATPVIAIGSPTASPAKASVQDVARTSTIAALLTQAATIMVPTETQPASEPSTTAGANVPTVEITPVNGSATVISQPVTPGNGTTVPPTIPVTPAATALPQTGWADEVGAPFMLGIAVLLIFVIILTRWLRATRTV